MWFSVLSDQKTSHSGLIPVKWLQFSVGRFSQIQLIIYGLLHLEKHSNTNPFRFVNFVLFTRDRILTNETQSNCFIPLSYSLIYIGCVKSYSAKFVRNHSLIRYFLHCDWLLPSTDLKGHSRLRWLCKPINVHNVHIHHLTCVTHELKSPTSGYPVSIHEYKTFPRFFSAFDLHCVQAIWYYAMVRKIPHWYLGLVYNYLSSLNFYPNSLIIAYFLFLYKKIAQHKSGFLSQNPS